MTPRPRREVALPTKVKRKSKPRTRRTAAAPPDLIGEAIAADRGTTGAASLLDAKGQLPKDLVIEWRSIAECRPYPNNPRKNQKAIVAVRDSLLNFGWQQPIVVDVDGIIIVGHTRFYAALDLEQREVPVYVARRLTEAQAKAYRLADNKTGELAEWDEPKLIIEFKALTELGGDLRMTGFKEAEITKLGVFSPGELDQDTEPDAIAPPLPKKPSSRRGDLYELGPHRLMCGDNRNAADLAKLMAGTKADLLWTDPPYGVDYEGRTEEKLTIENDIEDGLERLLVGAFLAADQILVPGARFYITGPAGRQGLIFRQAIAAANWTLHQVLVWVKDTMVLGHSDHHYRHEDVLFGWRPGHEDVMYGWKPGSGRLGRGQHEGSRWYGDNAQTTVFEIARPKRSDLHPTMKPIELIVRHLLNSTLPNMAVLDNFSGSGSTILACAQTGRRAFAMDIDPGYCDVTVERWETTTGGKAVRKR